MVPEARSYVKGIAFSLYTANAERGEQSLSLGGQALGALGRPKEKELMQDVTTSESEREMTLNEQLEGL